MAPHWVPLSEYERALLDRAGRWPGHERMADLTVEDLRMLASVEGPDLAAALLYDRIRRSPEHGPFIEHLECLPAEKTGGFEGTLVIVPGAFYREKPHTGADGRLLLEEAARLGIRAERIPIDSFGPLEKNARMISDWLKERDDGPIVLASLSKGGAEVKLALARPDAELAFRHVVLWISLSGIMNGTPLASWLLAQRWRSLGVRLLFWFYGYPFGVIDELKRGPGSLLDRDVKLPEHMKAIHVVGVPLVQHLSTPLARRAHRRLTPLGPSDGGGNLLGDFSSFPGLIYPVWGADHYLRPAWNVRILIARLLAYAGERIAETVFNKNAIT